jgi:hypothetical protein
MKTMYREQLDEMLRAQFGNRPDSYLALSPQPQSHAKHGLVVYYQDGHLYICCGKCKDRLAVIAVANEPASTALSA